MRRRETLTGHTRGGNPWQSLCAVMVGIAVAGARGGGVGGMVLCVLNRAISNRIF